MRKKLKKIVSKVKNYQFGGLISGLAGGLTGELFGKGLPNDNYDYQNTGHRSTSYDGLQYLPQAVQPNIMPQLLDAYNSQYKVKDFYDASKHKVDTGDLEKNLKARNYHKEEFRRRLGQVQKEAEEYILLNRRDPDKMAMFDIVMSQKKNDIMKDTQHMTNLYENSIKVNEQWASAKRENDQYTANNGQLAFTVLDKKTGQQKVILENELDNYTSKEDRDNYQINILPFSKVKNLADIDQESATKLGTTLNTEMDNMVDAQKSLQEWYKDTGYNLVKSLKNFAPETSYTDISGGYDNLIQTKWFDGTEETKTNKERLNQSLSQIAENVPKEILNPLKKNFYAKMERQGFRQVVNGKVGDLLTVTQRNEMFDSYVRNYLLKETNKREVDEKKTEGSWKYEDKVVTGGGSAGIADRETKKKLELGEVVGAFNGETQYVPNAGGMFGGVLDGIGGYLINGIGKNKEIAPIGQQNIAKNFDLSKGVYDENGNLISNVEGFSTYGLGDMTNGKKQSFQSWANKGSAFSPQMVATEMPVGTDGKLIKDKAILGAFEGLTQKYARLGRGADTPQKAKDLVTNFEKEKRQLGIEGTIKGAWATLNTVTNNEYSGGNSLKFAGSKKVTDDYAKMIREKITGKEDYKGEVYQTTVFVPVVNAFQQTLSDNQAVGSGNPEGDRSQDVVSINPFTRQPYPKKQSGGLLEDLEKNRVSFTNLTLDDLY